MPVDELRTPPRRSGSMRRTSSIDMLPHGELMAGGFDLFGRARDLRTDGSGAADVVADAALTATVDEQRLLSAIEAGAPAAAELVGHPASRGFRARAEELFPEDAAARTPRYLLLDDLPLAAMISGYADLYAGPGELALSGMTQQGAPAQADICAGWASEATMVRTIVEEGRFPVPLGPSAAEAPSGDELAWHDLDDLPSGAMRRRRRIDVWIDPGEILVDAMFRDTHVDAEGIETVLHEWWVDAAVDVESGTVTRCAARPGPLPWIECPSAAGSADRLVGAPAGELRGIVSADLRGTSTCTHLNDLLRSLADVEALAAHLR